jgi:hypothetical protein
MKKCKADFIAKKYPTWIDILDEVPKKRQTVEWLCANGDVHFGSIKYSHKNFLNDDSQYGVRYWREWKPKRSYREWKEVRGIK